VTSDFWLEVDAFKVATRFAIPRVMQCAAGEAKNDKRAAPHAAHGNSANASGHNKEK